MNMRRIIVIIGLLIVPCVAVAQNNGRTLKPNCRKIARVVKSPESPYFIDSLEARFSRCDTTMTVDGLRCLYYSGHAALASAHQQFLLLSSRFGVTSRRAGDAWWRYQMLLTAVWSSGDGSKRKPLYVTQMDDAIQAVTDFGSPLFFKIKGNHKKVSVAPQQ